MTDHAVNETPESDEINTVVQYITVLRWIVSQCKYRLRYMNQEKGFDSFTLNSTVTLCEYLILRLKILESNYGQIIPERFALKPFMNRIANDVRLVSEHGDGAIPVSMLPELYTFVERCIRETHVPTGPRLPSKSLFQITMEKIADTLYHMVGRRTTA